MSTEIKGPISASGLVITSLVFGILTVLTVWIPFVQVFPGFLAVLLGILGLRQVRRGSSSGKGMAVAGILCGVLGMIPTMLITGGLVIVLLFGEPTTDANALPAEFGMTINDDVFEDAKRMPGFDEPANEP